MVQFFLPVAALLAGSLLVIVAVVLPFREGDGSRTPAPAEASQQTPAADIAIITPERISR